MVLFCLQNLPKHSGNGGIDGKPYQIRGLKKSAGAEYRCAYCSRRVKA